MKNTTLALILMSCMLSTLYAQQTASKSSSDDLDAVISDLENNKPVKDRRVRLRNIQFLTGKAVFSPEDRAYLDTIAVFLVKAPTITMEIGGYTDNVGSDKVNNRLSQTRANAIRNYLVKEQNITAARLRAVGYGKRNPVATNETEEGRYANRRVELKVLGLTNDVYYIVTKDGKRIPANYVVTSKDSKSVSYRENENAPLVRVPAASVEYIEYPDGTRRLIGSTNVINEAGEKVNAPKPEEPTKELTHSGVDWLNANKRKPSILAQLNGMTTFILGDPLWKALPEGYAHTLGFGGTLFLEYKLNPTFFAGIEVGYLKWSTRIDLVESRKGPVIDQYFAEASQIPLLAHIRINLGQHFYIMPEGGLHLLKVKAGFGQPTDSFSGTQLAYGGALGYVHYLGEKKRVRLDIGAFYRQTTNSKTWDLQYGAAPMQYVGLRAGIGSLF
ncbi:hypothetical protein DR864_10695 [Runella rosea]|uniref:OmpA-like domain-containing protein n=1 Tax=Runella rosea TaxID=2259595 RepID=A0A344THQ4_9BACT|nr:OmpA family protein [Runella rosea]AXE18175.1 hypothetical protein DR864_10695 [Runella rosea]